MKFLIMKFGKLDNFDYKFKNIVVGGALATTSLTLGTLPVLSDSISCYGNHCYGSDGSSLSCYGNHCYGSGGQSWSTYGNHTYGSDGSGWSTYGNYTYGYGY